MPPQIEFRWYHEVSSFVLKFRRRAFFDFWEDELEKEKKPSEKEILTDIKYFKRTNEDVPLEEIDEIEDSEIKYDDKLSFFTILGYINLIFTIMIFCLEIIFPVGAIVVITNLLSNMLTTALFFGLGDVREKSSRLERKIKELTKKIEGKNKGSK